MRLAFSLRCASALAALTCWFVAEATAQPPNIVRSYRIVPSQSTVIATGGFGGWHYEYDVIGRFDLVTGYVPDVPCDTCIIPYAQFTDVDAWMIPLNDPRDWVFDLDAVLNLTGLEGTWDVPNYLHFTGLDGQGQPIGLDAVLYDRALRLIGASNPQGADMFQWTVDLYARQVPFADFDANNVVDAADYSLWRATFGEVVVPGEGADGNGNGVVDAADYVVWRDLYEELSSGAGSVVLAASVPEPATIVLAVGGIVLLAIAYRR